jgi:hypothetical protein
MTRICQIGLLGLMCCAAAPAGDRDGTLLYSNVAEPEPYYFAPALGQTLSDDMQLATPGPALMMSCSLATYAYETNEEPGWTFDVYVDFWSADPCGTPSLIAGTQRTFSGLPVDETVHVLTASFDPPIRIPRALWLRTQYASDGPQVRAGWIMGEQAEVGYTQNSMWIERPTFQDCAEYWFGTPWAGFVAEIIGQPIADLNCDGLVNAFDIDPFVQCLVSGTPTAPCTSCLSADIDGDGLINSFDIDPFVACIIHGGCP